MRLIFYFALTLLQVQTSFASDMRLHVLLDPGHGGRDHGTTKDGIHEADITLSVSQRLFAHLQKDSRFQVELTRDEDRSLKLNERSKMAKDSHADLFLSIHVNSSPDTHARGAEFYFQNQLPPDEESMFLAHRENDAGESDSKQTYDFTEKNSYPSDVNAILTDLLDSDRILRSSQLTKTLKLAWRGTRKGQSHTLRQAPFHVLSQICTPSALVELGFLTNREDFKMLTDPRLQEQMAEDLYQGLIHYQEKFKRLR